MDGATLFSALRTALESRRADSALLRTLSSGFAGATTLPALCGLLLTRRLSTPDAPEPILSRLLAQAAPSTEELVEDLTRYVESDFTADDALDILLFSDGFHALACHRRAHALHSSAKRDDARLLSGLAARALGAEIHPQAALGRRVFLDHGRGVVIGETATVGDDCTIFQGVTLGSTAKIAGPRHPALGRAVVVGAGAMVIGRITVGDGAVIAPNALVTRDVPAGARAS